MSASSVSDADATSRFGHSDSSEHFGQWLSRQRKARDLTQEELAERLGCSVWAIQKIEVGKRRPSKQVADMLADYFQIPPEEREAFLLFARGQKEHPGKWENSAPTPNLQPESHSRPLAQPNHPNNLPVQLTSFVGRDAELPRIRDLMLSADMHLLTLTGPPGTGKTRLALQVASKLLTQFEDGVFFVNLAPIADPDLVISQIAESLSVGEDASGSLIEAVKAYLGDKRLLLVLDNFEQVVEAAPSVAELLMTAPGLKVIVTSRVPLHIRGEKEFAIPPLHLPDMQHLPPLERLGWYEAVRLFVQRAQDVSTGFELTTDNAPAVAHICAKLDGLPLAIELAAARVKVLSPEAILSRLDSRLQLLTGGHRDLPARQRALRSAIEWSYDLLEDEEKKLFRRLGVFASGFSLEAAEAVYRMWNAEPGMPNRDESAAVAHSAFSIPHSEEVLEGISSLVDKSLVRQGGQEEQSGEPRFVMLESLREYAVEVLEASGEADELRRRHALYFLDLAERAEPNLRAQEQAMWFQRLEREHSNLRAAMSWSLARAEVDIVLRFGGALRTFWTNRYMLEGRWWAEGVLKWGAGEPSGTRARALTSAALMLRKTREYSQARAMIEESLRTYRALSDSWGIATSLRWLAVLMWEMDLPGERALIGQMLEESLERFQAVGDSKGVADMLATFAEMAREVGDYPKARDGFEKSLVILRKTKDKQRIADYATNLAYVLYHCAEYERAKTLLRESLDTYQEVVAPYNIAWALVAWAGIVRAQDDPHKAATLVGAANALAAVGGTPFDPTDQQDREEIEAAIKGDLSEQEWQHAQEQGRVMDMDQAITYALEE